VTLLTRRSLLRVGALAPLIIPGRSLARVGGAAAPAGSGPCGSPTRIATISQISGPGCYQLTQDDPASFAIIQYNNVTLLGNGHSLQGSLQLGTSAAPNSGLVVQDLTCQQLYQVYGSASPVQMTTPAVHLKGITVTKASPATLPVSLYGSNIFMENCLVDGSAGGTDDPVVLYNLDSAHPTSAWCTIANCRFGPNYDLGLEGVGGWDHVTITGCSGTGGNAWADLGAWYGPNWPGSTATNFRFDNCTITNNTMRAAKGMTFTDGSFLLNARSDAEATGYWGPSPSKPAGGANNSFSGNIYI
jgi:hypothetical protein